MLKKPFGLKDLSPQQWRELFGQEVNAVIVLDDAADPGDILEEGLQINQDIHPGDYWTPTWVDWEIETWPVWVLWKPEDATDDPIELRAHHRASDHELRIQGTPRNERRVLVDGVEYVAIEYYLEVIDSWHV